jgi:hypothetical protein
MNHRGTEFAEQTKRGNRELKEVMEVDSVWLNETGRENI